MRYLIVIESTETGYSVYAPDLPGCVSTGSSYKEAYQNMKEAIAFHIEGLQLEGLEIPPSTPENKITKLKKRPSSPDRQISCIKVNTEVLSR